MSSICERRRKPKSSSICFCTLQFSSCNALFAYYYFRTAYFQYLVEIHKKGLGNNTNIFPSQIQELPMIDTPLEKQQEIVDEIKIELDKQDAIKKAIN